jgi:hypothetical protein
MALCWPAWAHRKRTGRKMNKCRGAGHYVHIGRVEVAEKLPSNNSRLGRGAISAVEQFWDSSSGRANTKTDDHRFCCQISAGAAAARAASAAGGSCCSDELSFSASGSSGWAYRRMRGISAGRSNLRPRAGRSERRRERSPECRALGCQSGRHGSTCCALRRSNRWP